MKTDFDKEFEAFMTEKKDISPQVRKSLDDTYEMIQTRSRRKKKKSAWLRLCAAACSLLLAGGFLLNDEVRAQLSDFFSFQDKGIDKALVEGFGKDNESSATDQDIIMTLTQNFSDANKIGMSLELFFIDEKLVTEDITQVNVQYRLKNGDGEYIAETISHPKVLKSDNSYISSSEVHFDLDVEKGVIQYDEVVDSNKGNIPALQDAVLEVETINFYYEATEELQTIEGGWHLPFENQNNDDVLVHYVAKKDKAEIELLSAVASPTSLNMEFIVDSEPFGPEGQFMSLVDKAGVAYEAKGYHVSESGGKTTVNVNFPISAYENQKALRLVIEQVGELELQKE